MASNYAKFFERLADIFASVADHLPAFGEFYKVLSRLLDKLDSEKGRDTIRLNADRILQALSYVYVDVLQLCQEIYALLSRKERGKLPNISLLFFVHGLVNKLVLLGL